jgi:hypothetical protein
MSTLLLLVLLLFAVPALASPVISAGDSLAVPTGLLRVDMLHEAAEPAGLSFSPRNPVLAGGLSLAVPGLGQAYNRSWIRAGAALGLEVAMWTGFFVWRSRGQEGEDLYQAFAHREWDPVKYAVYLNNYAGYNGPGIDVTNVSREFFQQPERWTESDWQRMHNFFEDMRAAERVTVHRNNDGTGTGAAFSHVLHDFGEQQYYELIGKYFQYNPGWSDWPVDASGNPVMNPLPSNRGEATALFTQYAADHKRSNDFFRQASRVTSFVLANHLVAALDAAITAQVFNNRVNAGLALNADPSGGPVPMAALRVRL